MKIDPEAFTIQDYLHHTFECSCGKSHHTDVERILISEGALEQVPGLLDEMGYHHVFMVSDKNTYETAGKLMAEILMRSGRACTSYVISGSNVVPDEHTLGELLIHFNIDCDLILGVGTGTINDMCKFMSYQMGMQYFILATAPSMDGFASIGAALISGNLKTTYSAHVPRAIIGDINVLSEAPMNMIAAGVADILGKYTCLCDWHLAHIINGEYFCPVIEQMVRRSMQEMVSQAELLNERTPATIQTVMEALILTGIAMSFAGNSRPASGCEHHMSHYWEMKFLFEGRPAVLHGTKVGIGAVTAALLYHRFLDMKPDYEGAARKADQFDFDKWAKNMKRTYGAAAEGVIANEVWEKKNDPAEVKRRLAIIETHMDEIREAAERLIPTSQSIERILTVLEAPTNPRELGIDRNLVADSIKVAKEVRDRYTLLQLLWDLGVLEEMAEEVADSFFHSNVRGESICK